MFTLDQLRLTNYARNAVDPVAEIYNSIDELIWDAHRAGWDERGYQPVLEQLGTMELFAELYCCAADLWRGMEVGMTREEAITRAEECFSRIHYFYIGSRIHIN